MADEIRDRIRALETELAAMRCTLEQGDTPVSSRRHLLRAAAATAVGAVGASALAGRPASAATGGNLVLGQTNTAEATTVLKHDGPFTNLQGPGPIALKLDSPGGHLQFVGTSGDAVLGTYPDGTLTYNGGMGLLLWFADSVVRIASPSTAPIRMLSAPVRLYDSRTTANDGVETKGRIAGGETRGINIGFAEDGGTDLVTDIAVGIMANITIVNTTGSGFLTVGPPSATQPPTSNINWSTSGQVLANMAITGLSEAGFQVWAGGPGSTDFVIDVMAVLG